MDGRQAMESEGEKGEEESSMGGRRRGQGMCDAGEETDGGRG